MRAQQHRDPARPGEAGDIDTGGGKVWLRTTADPTFVVIDPKFLAIRARESSGSGALR